MLWGERLSPGSVAIGEAAGLPHLMPDADLVITGEGRYDRQSAAGKVPSYVLDLAARHGTPAVLIARQIAGPADAFTASRSLVSMSGSSAAAMTAPEKWLIEAARDVAARSAFG
jgi:glycerate kinase